jgi:hypothetical protein
MSTSIPHKLIYSYFIESTGILEVFAALWKSYLLTDDVIKLNKQEDAKLIELLKENIEYAFPRPVSKITPDLELLRYNAYWRLYGYTIKGKENFPKVPSYNKDFNKTFESIMYEIFQGILDKGITIEKLANPNALAELLDNLQKMLRDKTYNQVEDIAGQWGLALEGLLALLEKDELIKTRLGIRATGKYKRLQALADMLKISIPKETLYLLQLAGRMEAFLTQVEDTPEWNFTNASALFDKEDMVKEISSAWYQVAGRDFLADALSRRRSISPTAKVPQFAFST